MNDYVTNYPHNDYHPRKRRGNSAWLPVLIALGLLLVGGLALTYQNPTALQSNNSRFIPGVGGGPAVSVTPSPAMIPGELMILSPSPVSSSEPEPSVTPVPSLGP
jgi:hypothetical protein